MSYSRSFSKKVTVRYSGTVSYPASQSGGTMSYSGSASETVVVNVHVDTDPFDSEVRDMNGHVDMLTKSVVATQSAQVLSINSTSRKIGDTIISGFFKTVKSDISQQIAELKTRADALLLQLQKLAERCNDKKRQMGEDYQRTASRYGKIFTDLNNELENRVYSIDEPIFHAIRTMDDVERLSGSNDMVSTVAVSAGENAKVHSLLSADVAKMEAVKSIDSAKRFLDNQLSTDKVLDKCLRAGGDSASICAPFIVMEAISNKGVKQSHLYTSPLLDAVKENQMSAGTDTWNWTSPLPEKETKAISEYFKSEVAGTMNRAKNDHEKRVAEMTGRLFDLSKTTTAKLQNNE